jgi:negative regulator of sigma E activity
MAIIGLFLLLIIGVIVCQRIVQRYLFLLQKRTLVQEFQVVDLSRSSNNYCNSIYNNDGPFESVNQIRLHADDIQHLRKLGLLDGKRQGIVKT